jgi:hypothetical protein
MEHQNFTIDLWSTADGSIEASVAEAPLRDNPRVVFSKPVEQEDLEQFLCAFDVAGALIDEKVKALPVSPRAMGERIFTGLFTNGLGEHFVRCRDYVTHEPAEGLRVRLRFRSDDPLAPYLAALPWERLWEPRVAQYVAIDAKTPLVREIAGGDRRTALEVELPLRILVVDAAPAGQKSLNLKLEIERMTEALQPLLAEGRVELLRLPRVTKDALRDALLAEEIHVLHFMGHGGYDPSSGNGSISFENADGTGDKVDGEMLAEYLKQSRSLGLVVLNACQTARHAGRGGAPWNEGVAAAILKRTAVPAVVANQCSISDATAVEFSRVFYGGLAKGDAIDEAMTEARLRLWARTKEWATPVLFLSAPSGKILVVKEAGDGAPASIVPTTVHVEVGARSPVCLGVRSFDGYGKDMESRNDQVLDLVPWFNGRFIKDKSAWQEALFPALRGFLKRLVDERRPLLLDFAAHSSLAFAAGWLLEPKSGLDVRVRQRTGGVGEIDWHPKDGSEPPADTALWLERDEIVLDPLGEDVAVALSVSQPDVADDAAAFIRSEGLPVGRIVDATIAPAPGQSSVRGGAHSLRLAQALLPRLQPRKPHERGGRVHVFCSAPNALVFYLGQLASSLGTVVLYEFPYKAKDPFGRYQRSIELPPPGEAAQIPDGF